jgi:hypothetical protein
MRGWEGCEEAEGEGEKVGRRRAIRRRGGG